VESTVVTEKLSERFKQARERACLSIEEVAARTGLSKPCIWDLEVYPDELTSVYSLHDVRRFAGVLGITASDLLGASTTEDPISAVELVRLIHDQCRSRGIQLEQFEDIVEWKLADSLEPPEKLLEDMSLDGLQWLCRELGIDWQRVVRAV
jgi:transcriptional regulator with XRE-family HTH domain